MVGKLIVAIVLMLFVCSVFAQNVSSPVSTNLSVNLPSPTIVGSRGSITVKIKNILARRPPVEIYATAEWEFNGQTYTAESNHVTIQVVQPVTVRRINLALPNSIQLVDGINLPLDLGITLLEGEETQVNIPIEVR